MEGHHSTVVGIPYATNPEAVQEFFEVGGQLAFGFKNFQALAHRGSESRIGLESKFLVHLSDSHGIHGPGKDFKIFLLDRTGRNEPAYSKVVLQHAVGTFPLQALTESIFPFQHLLNGTPLHQEVTARRAEIQKFHGKLFLGKAFRRHGVEGLEVRTPLHAVNTHRSPRNNYRSHGERRPPFHLEPCKDCSVAIQYSRNGPKGETRRSAGLRGRQGRKQKRNGQEGTCKPRHGKKRHLPEQREGSEGESQVRKFRGHESQNKSLQNQATYTTTVQPFFPDFPACKEMDGVVDAHADDAGPEHEGENMDRAEQGPGHRQGRNDGDTNGKKRQRQGYGRPVGGKDQQQEQHDGHSRNHGHFQLRPRRTFVTVEGHSCGCHHQGGIQPFQFRNLLFNNLEGATVATEGGCTRNKACRPHDVGP